VALLFWSDAGCPIVQLQNAAGTNYEGLVHTSLISFASARNVPFSVAGLFMLTHRVFGPEEANLQSGTGWRPWLMLAPALVVSMLTTL
jgi:hypothetical protein